MSIEMVDLTLPQHAGNLVKTVLPKGDILNDRGTNVDHLEHIVFARALARQIQRVKTPITIGIFSRWGSGKTFLLKHVQSLIAAEQDRTRISEEQEKLNQKIRLKDQIFAFLTTLLPVLVFLVSLILMILFRTKVIHAPNLQVVLVILLIIFLLAVFWIILNFGKKWLNDNWSKYGSVIFSALFIKLPIEESDAATVRTTFSESTSLRLQNNEADSEKSSQDSPQVTGGTIQKKSRRFIFVNFNAWEYAGSDVLWAGIIATLVEKVEDEFGMCTTRLFRSLTLEKTTKDQLLQEFKQILIKISHDCSKKEIYNLMLEYGAVIYCDKYSQWKLLKKCKENSNQASENWWIIKFVKPSEAKYASKAMKCFGFEVCYINDSNQKFENEKQFSKWEQFRKCPKSICKVPNWVWCSLFVLACIVVPVATFMFINFAEKSEEKGQETEETEDVIGKVLSFLPAGFGIAFSVLKAVWAFLNSQQSRVNKALKGVKETVKNELGFMNKVKNEVNSVVDLIHTVEFATGLKYKIIVTIDDLDRVPLPKVKAVLEAVNILLSQQYSPYICLIAIDSRIAVKCFETIGEGVEGQTDSTLNGYEYLKKIINLPFCLPEIDNDSKTTFIEGLIDEADDTEVVFERIRHINTSARVTPMVMVAARRTDFLLDDLTIGPKSVKEIKQKTRKKITENIVKSSLLLSQKDFDEFLFSCRLFMHQNDTVKNHLYGNPRNIKRIFNVTSIIASVIQCDQERVRTLLEFSFILSQTIKAKQQFKKLMTFVSMKRPDNSTGSPPGPTDADRLDSGTVGNNEATFTTQQNSARKRLAELLVLWVVLTDQWPFRMSYIIQVIENADLKQRVGERSYGINDDVTISDIYSLNVRNMLAQDESSETFQYLMKLDSGEDRLNSLLENSKQLTKGIVKQLIEYSINLDGNLKQTICYQIDKANIE